MTDKPRLSTEEIAMLGTFGHPTRSAAEVEAERRKLAEDTRELAAIRKDNATQSASRKPSAAEIAQWDRWHGVREQSRVGGFVEPASLDVPYVRECDRIADYFAALDRKR
jgi:hypothetical protein